MIIELDKHILLSGQYHTNVPNDNHSFSKRNTSCCMICPQYIFYNANNLSYQLSLGFATNFEIMIYANIINFELMQSLVNNFHFTGIGWRE